MDAIVDTVRMIDWKLLREQKQWLLKHANPEANGLVCLLDSLQDAAIDDGIANESDVFAYEVSP